MIVYHKVSTEVCPKRVALEEAQDHLKKAREVFVEKQM